MMRIVYLINGLNGGGAAFPMVRVIGLMRELGHEVRVIALMPQDGKAAVRLVRAGIPYEVIGSGAGDFFAPALRLTRRLRTLEPQLIWTSLTRGTIYGQLIGRLLRIPVVSWQHSAFLKRGNAAVLRRTLRLTARWIADSDAVNAFARAVLGVEPDKISTWPPFVADSAAPVAGPWTGTGLIRLGTLGRLHSSKQYDVLLRAFSRARQLDTHLSAHMQLLIAGEGPERQYLQTLVPKLGLQGSVTFAGFVAQPASFLASLHAYVQTSMKEGFCIAAHEAMLAGLPVISTRVGELAYSVRPGNTGWLCEVGDTEALARAMVALVHDPAEAAHMGSNARAIILDRYSPARFQTAGRALLERIQREVVSCATP
jgi:glycosyltransferase involved in cell wall biosynthesis